MESDKSMQADLSKRQVTQLQPRAIRMPRRLGLVLAGLACASGMLVVSPSLASASSKSSAACSVLSNGVAGAKFRQQIVADEESKNVAGMRKLFVNLINDAEKLSSYIPTALKSTPANVKAAIKTIGREYPQLKTALGKATTESELLEAFVVFGRIPAVASAETTLGNYVSATCKG